MIYTGNYITFGDTHFDTVSISKDRGKSANYSGNSYSDLFPKEGFFRIWRENANRLSKKENSLYYIERYYEEVLKGLNPETVYKDLDNKILLCYEDSLDFCHRHIVSAWLELLLDIEVNEVELFNNQLQPTYKPEYIKDMLEKYMISVTDMQIFNTVRAVYLYEKEKEREEHLKCQITEYNPSPFYLINRNLLFPDELYQSDENEKIKTLSMSSVSRW